ncbi:phosphorylase b kinase gamma catalytic chain, skeletal muscle/heart isoform isoform X1 [Bactrocera neohumeralis]|uniref:phosphorylase b kinase gamma catalytic chain, skeletal muscle/heart isoform isoform X1 n=1 Tax=Bactrocera neohumeralis TaxID=98809 RepID=UPI0021666E44|nr:phosphorylase b kinase gamma catalytic chain, skeletal muscle/heart isoform isoform X1 [Bactrocera neohumeralis]XP_050331156.1 phosphorylase b kinase gamma catalytic chain, skeletal muscle/heart isoform isoform X1 [Bactrocera neohumeralis]XP_050331157.1 phosphorylase b kinase gamma catalytic chain, skeletal muscle/heart isoform isoform X1 [Bactrocera neohumeralis]XP_050331158.1 phosphorylase b kinase gamma catalytic chain, skeletal muscle/heart isoform isoform X1 [Bactrocera neohumeralis]
MAKDEEEDDVLPDKDAAKGFYAKYEPKEILGRGISSTVRRCIEKETGIEFAAKIIDLGAATEAGDTNPYHMLEATRQEISILRQVMGHPYIIDLQDVFESDAFVFLVFELCPKGELFDYLTSVVTLSEKKTRTIMRQIFEGVEYIHAKNIVHRDLKPENILLDENHNVKITDFGFARQLKGDEKLTDLCGTPGYLAPETLKCNMFEGSPGYSKEVDIWACGVIMFTLLVGCPPFWHRKQMVMLRNIMEGKYSFTSPEWADISEDPKDLIRKCLVVDPAKRITVKEVLKHPFFNQMLFEQNIDGLKRSLSTKSRRMSRINDIALVLCSEPSTDGRTTYQLKSQNLRNSPSSGAQLYYNPNIIKTQTNYSYNKLPSTYASNNISNNNNRKSMTNLYLNKQASNQSNNSNNTYTTNATTSPSTTFPQAYNNNYNQRNYQSNGNAFDNTTAGPTTFLSTNQNNNSIGNATPTPTLFITQEQQQQQQQQQLLYQQQQQCIQKQQQTYEQQRLSISWCCGNENLLLRKQSRFNARKKFQFAILVIRAMIRIRRLRYTAEPLRVEEAIRDPYRVKVLRKVIDGCAFRVYGHWVKKGEGQNRAALFENTPRTELHALYINNLSR